MSAVVAEQSSNSQATGTVNTAFGTKYTTEQSGNQVSQLASQIGATKQVGSPPGRGMIGCGGSLVVISILAMITNAAIGEPERNDPAVFIGFFVVAFALIFGGRYWNKASRTDLKNYNEQANKFNMRVQNAWYCTRCNVRFDSNGSF